MIHLFDRPLITGASVSADWNAISPGKRLGLKFGHNDVRTIARGGTPGVELLKRVPVTALEGRSIVIAMDILFWDSTLSDPRPSVRALETFLAQVTAAKIPAIVGNIPELLPGRQPLRNELNREIERICAAEPSRFLFRLDELHRETLRRGTIEVHGRNYSLREMVPDGLHLSEVAGDFLAEKMLDLVTPLKTQHKNRVGNLDQSI